MHVLLFVDLNKDVVICVVITKCYAACNWIIQKRVTNVWLVLLRLVVFSVSFLRVEFEVQTDFQSLAKTRLLEWWFQINFRWSLYEPLFLVLLQRYSFLLPSFNEQEDSVKLPTKAFPNPLSGATVIFFLKWDSSISFQTT